MNLRFGQGLRRSLFFAAVVMFAGTAAAFFIRGLEPFELLSNFAIQVLGLALILTVLSVVARASAAAHCLYGLAAAICLIGFCLPQSIDPKEADGGPQKRLIWANLYRREASLKAVAQLANETQADYVAMTEVPVSLALLKTYFPNWKCLAFDGAPGDPFAVAVVSRDVCQHVAENRFSQTVDVGNMRIVALHVRPAWDTGRLEARNAGIAYAFGRVTEAPPSLVVGDFNATPWSNSFPKIPDGVQRINCGAAFAATWNTSNPVLGLRLDQVFASKRLNVSGCKIGPEIGSDHRPLIVSIGGIN